MNSNALGTIERTIDRAGLGCVFVISYLYSTFTSTFAEVHVQLSFLDFPIFIGEILLGVCLILLFAKGMIALRQRTIKCRWWHVLMLSYVAWVLLKAAGGYIQWGPMSFRNAALFYYPAFAACVYYFSRESSMSDGVLFSFLLLCVVTSLSKGIDRYFLLTDVFLCAIIILVMRHKWLKGSGIIAMFYIVVVHSHEFFVGSRTHLISFVASSLFIIFYIMRLSLIKLKPAFKLLLALLLIVLIFAGIVYFADSNALRSMTNLDELKARYWANKERIEAKRDGFKFQELEVTLYKKNDFSFMDQFTKREEIKAEILGNKNRDNAILAAQNMNPDPDSSSNSSTPSIDPAAESGKKIRRDLYVANNNILFRIFVWEDMLRELKEEKALFGLSFGKPQRSRSLEILGWAYTEWSVDGYITPHNSFLHFINRAGILGALIVGTIVGLLIKMAMGFMKRQSLIGGLFIAILIYWVSASQFLVILELPYFAIPFWSLFGLAMAYYHRLTAAPVHEDIAHP